MLKTLLLWLCLVLLSPLSSLSAEEKQPPRIAVISSDKSGWGDLLMTRLSKDPAVSLVERDDLGKVLDEVELKELLGDRKKRSRFGEIAGADSLVLLDVMGPRARLVVCDTRLGVSLVDFRMQLSEQAQEQTLDILVGTVLRTLRSFEGGVRHVVAVPDFISRDLTFEHAYLQRDYAYALQTAYRQIPGTAIVAVEEAKAIAAERDLAPEKSGKRLVASFIEGEFRVSRDPQTSSYAVEMTLRARNGSEALVEKKLPSTAISESFKLMMECVEEDGFKLTTSANTKIDKDAQYLFLLERAMAFSTIGDYANSTSLMEAALQLKPDNDMLRLDLIKEYRNQARAEKNWDPHAWPKGAKLDASNSEWMSALKSILRDWQRSMQHCAYLVDNRRVSRERACVLARMAFECAPRFYKGECLGMEEFNELQWNFIVNTYVQVAYLEPAKNGELGEIQPCDGNVTHWIFYSLFSIRGNKYSDLNKWEMIVDLLTKKLPHSLTFDSSLCDSIKHYDYNTLSSTYCNRDDMMGFFKRLIASDRGMARAYGYYGMVQIGLRQGEISPELLTLAERTVQELDELDFEPLYEGMYDRLRSPVKEIKIQLEAKSNPPSQQHTPASPVKPYLPEPLIRLEQIHLELVNTDKTGDGANSDKKRTNFSRFSAYNNYRDPHRFRAMGEDLDALWSYGAVFFIGKQGKATEVLTDSKIIIADVVHDGKYVWVAAYDGWGLAVLDKSGKVLARIDEKQGLPPGKSGGSCLVVHPVSPGCIMVSGSFSNLGRSWIAIVRFDGGKSSVDLVHQATHTRGYVGEQRPHEPDVLLSFMPIKTYEHMVHAPVPRRLIFINHWPWGKPIRVSAESTETWIMPHPGKYPEDRYPEGYPNTANNNFASIDGTLWVAGLESGFSGYQYENSTGTFKVVRDKYVWSGVGVCSMAHHGEWLYCVGTKKWLRYNLRTQEEQILAESVRALRPGTDAMYPPPELVPTIWNSSQYGLVAFYAHSGLYHVKFKIDPDE